MTFNVTPKYSHSEAFDFNALGSKDKDYSYVHFMERLFGYLYTVF